MKAEAEPQPQALPVGDEDPRRLVAMLIDGRADLFDREEALPRSLLREAGRQGWLSGTIPTSFGGRSASEADIARLCEALGRESCSLLSAVTVHTMAAHAIVRWGTPELHARWLAHLAQGARLAAFALTEPEAGSDTMGVASELRTDGNCVVLSGRKRWISMAQLADVFLVVARQAGKLVCVLVPADTPGLTLQPVRGLLGFRSAMLADLHFDQCRLPATDVIGGGDFGQSQIVGSILDHGRHCIAWGAVGLAAACAEATIAYTSQRKQFGKALLQHPLVQKHLADMSSRCLSARLMCRHATRLRMERDPDSIMATIAAKQFACTAAEQVALDGVQLHGANGCSEDYPVQRHLRDAKVLNLIEGTAQIGALVLGSQPGWALRQGGWT